MLWRWDAFIKEGDELFSYMVQHFQEMCSNHIKHFDIRYEYVYDLGTEELKEKMGKEKMGKEIEQSLIYWIKNEYDSLLKKDNWKPFRDKYVLSCMYLGYRRMFQYKQYYFQLSITDENDSCVNDIHFELILYGWKDDICDTLQPDDRVIIPPDNMMPDYYWDRE